jgi:hypothetical protein
VEEFSAGVGLARLDVELEGFALRIDQLDGDFFIKVARLGDDQGGEELLGARDGALGGVIFFVDDLSGVGIEQNGGFRGNGNFGAGGGGGEERKGECCEERGKSQEWKSGFGWRGVEQFFHGWVFFNPEFNGFEIMALRQLDGGRFFLKVKCGEIVVGVRVGRVEFHGAAEFLLGAIDPAFAADDDAEEIAGAGVLRVEERGLREGGEGLGEAVLVHVNHAQGEPGRGGLDSEGDGLFEEFLGLRAIARGELDQAEIHQSHGVLWIEGKDAIVGAAGGGIVLGREGAVALGDGLSTKRWKIKTLL